MPGQRRYDSQLRRQQAAETRERIISAGSELVHEFPDWDWRGLTVTAVAARSEVNLRTVYRHFANERELRDAVMRRLEEEAGVTLESMHLEDFADLTARVIRYLASLSIKPAPLPDEPTFVDTDQRRRDALLAAVEPLTGDWSDDDRRLAAALLDICWSLPAYERLVSAWSLDTEEVTRAISWFVHLLEDAVRTGRGPTPRTAAPAAE